MDLRALECVVAVAEEGSISRAAARLHMTQPPLTVRLRSLERELGVELLVRHGRGVDLTAAGRVLVERARRVLADVSAAAEEVRTIGLGTRGRFGVVVGHTVSPRLLPHLAGGALGGGVDLTVTEATDADVVERVHRRDAHAGLLHLAPGEPGRTRHPRARARGLEVAVVAREPLVAVLPDTHPEAGGDRVDLSLVRGARVVVAEATGEGFAAHVRAAWAVAAPDGTYGVVEAGSIVQAMALVEAGAGVTLLPAQYTSMVWGGLVARPPRQHTPVVETAVCWRPDEDSPVLRRFLRTALSTPEPDVLGPAHARHGLGAAHW